MPVADAKRAFEIVVNAYRKVRPLSNEEIQAIPSLGVMFWIFYLGFQYTNFDDWSKFFFGPRYLKDRVKTIQRYIEIIPYIL
jgi:Ser/Thr protein kinase RdoA (MazF antagonist)